ncbi:tetratricopeptide repeat protein [Virgibacillus sp. FSP13]
MVDWEFLNIEPTTDIKQIKRAYAKQLKIHHPEDDPEGYQKLRETFEQAKRYARENKVAAEARDIERDFTETASTSDILMTDNQDGNANIRYDEEADHESYSYSHDDDTTILPNQETDESLQDVNAFMDQVEELYANYPARIGWYNWEKLLEADIVWDMRSRDILTYRLLGFLKEHNQFPKSIWRLLNKHFNLEDNFPEFFYECMIRPEFHYQSLVKEKQIDRDTFLYYREKFSRHLNANQLAEARDVMKKAEEIFADDPDFLRLQAEFHRRTGDYNEAICALQTYTEIQPDDIDILLQKAHLLFDENLVEEALKACKVAKAIQPDNLQILRLEGQCLYKTGALKQARKKFEFVLAEEKLDIVSQTYLAKVDAKLGKEDLVHENKRNVQQEMGIMSIREKIRLYWNILPKFKVFVAFILILGVPASLNSEYKKSTGAEVYEFFKQKIDPPEIIQVEKRSDFPKPGDKDFFVSTTLKDAFFTGYYKTQSRDENNQTINGYFTQSEARNLELLDDDDAELVWGGYLEDGTPVLCLLPYAKDRELESTHDIEIVGSWQPVPPEALGTKLANAVSTPFTFKSMEEFSQNKLINGSNIANSDANVFDLLFASCLYFAIFIALLYYIWTRVIKLLLQFRY